MVAGTLIVAGAMSVGVGLCFSAVARAVGAKHATATSKTALRAFSAWWAGLALYLVIQGSFTIAAAFIAVDPALYFASRIVLVPVLCLAVWGITTYLLFLYTGRPQVFVWVGMFYALVGVAFYWATFTTEMTVHVERWIITIDDSSMAFRVVYMIIGLPPIVAAVAYLGLLRSAGDRLRRYRIVLVSGSILAYVGSGLAARLSANDIAIFATLVLFGGVAAAAALLAFYPPPRIRAWLQATPAQRRDRTAVKVEQRHRRMGELI